jgi:hypothetical protein
MVKMNRNNKILHIIIINILLAGLMLFTIGSNIIWAASAPIQINVVGGDEGRGGTHAGGFSAIHRGIKIEVAYAYSPNQANPIAHPVKVYKGNKQISDWDYYLQQVGNQQSVIKGKQIKLVGKWQDQTTFEAYKIYLPANINNIGER